MAQREQLCTHSYLNTGFTSPLQNCLKDFAGRKAPKARISSKSSPAFPDQRNCFSSLVSQLLINSFSHLLSQ